MAFSAAALNKHRVTTNTHARTYSSSSRLSRAAVGRSQPLAPPRPCRLPIALRCAASSESDASYSTLSSSSSSSNTDAWQRLSLLKRKLDVAVSEEQYSLAAQLRDDAKALVASLPVSQLYLYRQVQQLRNGTTSEKLAAIKAMAETGDPVVVPDLAACLVERELQGAGQEALWTLFMSHPDPAVNELMVEGVGCMANPLMHEQAMAVFTAMIDKAPDFPEGYNKRATLLYQMRQYAEAIQDCQKVLSMQPHHFGAASGMGLCHLMLNEHEQAIQAFELALSINPALENIGAVMAQLRAKVADRQRREQAAAVQETEAETDAGSGA